jgi:hypothetical protein
MSDPSTNEEDKVYVNAIVTIRLDTGIDLTGADSVTINVKYPEPHTPPEATWISTIEGTKIKYTTLSTDLDVAGEYFLQAIYNIVAGEIPGDTAVLRVSERYK